MQPKPGVPEAPDVVKLDLIALEEWNRISPELAAMDVLTQLDAPALTAYCMNYAVPRVREAD